MIFDQTDLFEEPSASPQKGAMEERRIPPEYRRWRRWSDHFEKVDMDAIRREIENEMECENCGAYEWDSLDVVFQCRSCGFTLEGIQTPRDPNLRFSTRCSRAYEDSTSDSSSDSDTMADETLDDIPEDGALGETATNASPRRFSRRRISNRLSTTSSHRLSSHSSVGRRSIAIPTTPKPPKQKPWWETEESHTVQFTLTPRGKENASTSSGRGAHHEPDTWQRMLATAIFLLPKAPDKEKPSTLDIALLPERAPNTDAWTIKNGGAMAIAEETPDEHGNSVVTTSSGPKKQVLWRVSLRPKDGK